MSNQDEYYRDNSHITGKLDLNEIPKAIREKQYGVDVREAIAQATEEIKEIKGQALAWGGDEKNYFPNGDLLIPGKTDPYLPLNGVDLTYVAPTYGFADDIPWVQIIGHDDDTGYKGVRVKLDLDTYPARYWRPTDLSFILRNDDTGDSLFHIEMNVFQKTGGGIVYKIADFVASHDVNNKVKVIVPAPVDVGAQQGNIDSIYYHIWTEKLRHVNFRMTGITGKFHSQKINLDPDQELAKNNLLGITDAKNGSIAPYVGLNDAEKMYVELNILSHNWVTAKGTDNQTAGKGIGINFKANTPDCFAYYKKFTGLVRTKSASNLNYAIAITYVTSSNSVTMTLDRNIILSTSSVAKLEYTIPSPKSLGIDQASLLTGRIQIYTDNPSDFTLSATEWSLKNVINNNGKTFTDNKALFVADNNFSNSAWSYYDLSKSIQVVNDKMTTHFLAVGTAKYRAAQLLLNVNEKQKNNNIKANIELMNSDPASKQFTISARYDYVTKDGIQRIAAPTKRSVAAPVNEWIKVKDILIPSAFSQGVPANAATTVVLLVSVGNEADNTVNFYVGDTNLELLAENNVSLLSEPNNLTLPTVKLYGAFENMTGDTYVTMQFQFNDHGRTIKGYSDTKWQGDSSLLWPKKNLRLKLYTDKTLATKLKITPDPRFPKGNKFNLKANYIQTFSARNLVTSELLREVVSSRQSITPYVAGLNNYGAIVGFPVVLYINDNFYGLMTLNTTKDIITDNLSSENPLAFAIQGSNGADSNRFKASTATVSAADGDFDFSLLGKDEVTPEIQTSINNLLKFVNESSDEDFIAHISEHYDVDSVIDWVLMVDAAELFDLQSKNITHLTEDGTKFYAMMYDLDGSFANGWQGTDKHDPNRSYIPDVENKLYSRIVDNFKDKIKDRYAELVSLGIFTTNHIQKLFETFIASVGQANYELDQNRWPDNPATNLFTYDETMDIVRKRMNVTKNDVTKL